MNVTIEETSFAGRTYKLLVLGIDTMRVRCQRSRFVPTIITRTVTTLSQRVTY